MTELLIFIIASIGMAHILVDGSIFDSFKIWLGKGGTESRFRFFRLGLFRWMKGKFRWAKRKILSLTSCYACSGFWSGVIIGLCMWLNSTDPLHADNTWRTALVIFAYGCGASIASSMTAVIIMWLQAHSGVKE